MTRKIRVLAGNDLFHESIGFSGDLNVIPASVHVSTLAIVTASDGIEFSRGLTSSLFAGDPAWLRGYFARCALITTFTLTLFEFESTKVTLRFPALSGRPTIMLRAFL